MYTAKAIAYLDGLMLSKLPEYVLSKELPLYRRKAFDYRPLHPVQATQLFALEYKQRAKRYREQHQTAQSAQRFHNSNREAVFQTDDVMLGAKKSVLLGLWKGRQAADDLGATYDQYVRLVFQASAFFKWKRAPGPNHMATDSLTEYVKSRIVGEGFKPATHEDYQLGNKHPEADHQVDYLSYIISKLMTESNPRMILENLQNSGAITPGIKVAISSRILD